MTKPLHAGEAQPLAGTEGAEAPFWSPDSRFIAFGASGKLKKIAASGGLVHTLCDARVVLGGSWNRNDVIVFDPSESISRPNTPPWICFLMRIEG